MLGSGAGLGIAGPAPGCDARGGVEGVGCADADVDVDVDVDVGRTLARASDRADGGGAGSGVPSGASGNVLGLVGDRGGGVDPIGMRGPGGAL